MRCREAITCLLALCLSCPVSAKSDYVRASKVVGADLAAICRADIEPSQLDPCNAFIVAATDAYQLSRETCLLAPDAYVPVAVGVVRKYLNDHPEKLCWPAALLVRLALQEKFPCPTETKK